MERGRERESKGAETQKARKKEGYIKVYRISVYRTADPTRSNRNRMILVA
jgi:hypothetical protein